MDVGNRIAVLIGKILGWDRKEPRCGCLSPGGMLAFELVLEAFLEILTEKKIMMKQPFLVILC